MNKMNVKRSLGIFFGVLFIAVFSVSIGYAAGLHTIDTNYINDHIGDKATGLAGAYCAISDDPSGAYYNPAGLIFAFDNQISLSVNNYKKKHIEYEDIDIGSPTEKMQYSQNFSSFYPSFFGVVQSLGDFKIGLTIININNEIMDQDTIFEATGIGQQYTINYNITDNTLMMGLSLAHFFLSDSVAIGATVYGLKRRSEEISNMVVLRYSDGAYSITNTYITEDIYGMICKFGIQYMPTDLLSIGATFEYGYIIVHDWDFKQKVSSNLQTNLYTANRSADIDTFEERDEYPMVLRAGVAYFPSKLLTLSLDIIGHIGKKYYQLDVEDTINYALGMEYYVTPSFPVRIGLFTNFSNTPAIEEGIAQQEMHVDMYGASLSLSWQTRSSTISLTGSGQGNTLGNFQLAEGKGQPLPGEPGTPLYGQVNDVKIYQYQLSLTGSAKY